MTRRYFGTDGIRDVAGQGRLAPGIVRAVGGAVGALLLRTGPSRVLVGRDTRGSGKAIIDQLAEGIVGSGHELVDGGVLTTPAVQTLCREEGFDLAVVISASHNPAQDNGIKFFGSDGRKLPDELEAELEGLIERGAEPEGGGAPAGRRSDPEAGDRYLAFLRARLPDLDLAGTKVVLDCAHGAGSTVAPEALRRFGAGFRVVGAEPDGSNINAGVGVFHVEDLAPLVREEGALLAMALDGDGDRVLLLDEQGRPLDGDHMLGMLAVDLHDRGLLPGDLVVTTVMANMGLFVHLRKHGIAYESVPVGDRFVAEAMARRDAGLGGEQSGHVIFRENGRWYGDGLYTALRVLELAQRAGAPLSALAAGIEKFPQRLVNVRVQEQPPLDQVTGLMQVKEAVERRMGADGRVVLRYSGTEPLLRVMVEGRHIDQVEAAVDELVAASRRALA